MLEKVMNYGIIFYAMAIIMTIGAVGTIFSYITISKLVKSAGDIQKSNQRLMKLVKAKFEHASMVSDRVQNVEAFVKKYLYEYKVLGMRLGGWHSFPLKMVCLIVAIGAVGALLNYRVQGMTERTFWYGAFAAIYAVILLTIHILTDGKTKLDAAKNYMVEYLENVCAHRYEKAGRAVKVAESEIVAEENMVVNEEMQEEKLTEEEPEIKEKLNARLEEKEEPDLEEKLQNAKEEQMKKEKDEQEMRIRAILQEFLA